MRSWLLAAAVAAVSYAGVASARDCREHSAYCSFQQQDGVGGGGEMMQPAPTAMPYEEEDGALWRGLEVTANGGIEGFFGDTNDWVQPGPTWGVTIAGRPTRALGIELNYTGAAFEADEARVGGDPVNGADIVRNGGHAIATLGIAPEGPGISPYALAGIGFNHFNVRGGQAVGFRSNTGGAVPVGAGLKAHLGGGFAADLRFNYNIGFNEDFLPTGDNNASRYQATLGLGGHF